MPRTGRIVLPGYPHHIVQRGHNLPRTVTDLFSRGNGDRFMNLSPLWLKQ